MGFQLIQFKLLDQTMSIVLSIYRAEGIYTRIEQIFIFKVTKVHKLYQYFNILRQLFFKPPIFEI